MDDGFVIELLSKGGGVTGTHSVLMIVDEISDTPEATWDKIVLKEVPWYEKNLAPRPPATTYADRPRSRAIAAAFAHDASPPRSPLRFRCFV